MNPYISIVIPVYNEALTLPIMFSRLLPVMDAYGKSYEIIFVNDGSRDESQKVLANLFNQRPDVIRVIDFMRNYGQHPAIMAGFEHVRGEVIVTLDCDLQNPPEDIPKMLDLIEQGHDVVGGYRGDRQDLAWRKAVSRFSNIVREKITSVRMKDHGCMLRAYRRSIIDQIVQSRESSPFITALSQYLAGNPIEIEVGHEERAAGESNYNLYKLIRYNFDLVTSFSLVPLQLFTITGMVLSGASFLLVIYMILRRVFIGPEAEGIFTLFAILFFLVSVAIMGLGIIGEYVGRIYKEIRHRPRYMIREVLEQKSMKLLILGANGFIGSNLSQYILQHRHWEIVAMDLHNDKLTDCMGNPRFHFMQGNILKQKAWVEEQVSLCDVVLPLVAIATPETYVKNPLAVFELDFEANLEIVRHCAAYNKRVIFPSTSEVYGMSPDLPYDEANSTLVTGPIEKERWIYSCSKQMMDRVIYAYGKHRDLDFTLMRPFNWFGPGLDNVWQQQSSSRVVSQFLSNILHKRDIVLVGGGESQRCFLYIDDAIDALVRIIENKDGCAAGGIFNIGDPNNEATIAQLAEMMLGIMNEIPGYENIRSQVKITHVSGADHYGSGYQDVVRRVPNIDRAKTILGWSPSTNLHDGIKKTIEYYLAHKP